MARIIISEEQFKNLCRGMLQESRKVDYIKNLLKESFGSTSSGLEYDTLDPSEINKFDGYDRSVAQCHIDNVGCIIVHAGTMEPIDNEYDLNEIYGEIENSAQ